MVNGKKVVVVLPAYNASKTLFPTFNDIPFDIVDDVILTDDFSNDNTIDIAKCIGINHILKHEKNLGYGANQKTCYAKALELDADIIIMLHPDYQYNPKLITDMCSLITSTNFQVILGSRILGKSALKEGMPFYKYFFNRVLTFIQNILMEQKLSEYHTGYRCFEAKILREIPFKKNSNTFIFDNQILAQICYKGFEVGEISCPAKYEKDSSSINFSRSIIYGLGVLGVSWMYFLQKLGFKFKLFKGL